MGRMVDMQNELRVIENSLVPVYETDRGERVVYGSELHQALEVQTPYRLWSERRLQECDAEEDVDYTTEQICTVVGGLPRKGHIRTAYKDWFPRMCEYGFTEGTDFSSILSESTGGRPGLDHELSIDMAKEICMIQRTPIGKKCREYLEKSLISTCSFLSRFEKEVKG